MKRRLALLFLLLAPGFCTAQLLKTYSTQGGIESSMPLSNSINDIVVWHDTVWVGTGRGLNETVNNGKTWIQYGSVAPFTGKGISGIAINDEIIWVAAAGSTKQGDSYLPQGLGLYYSTNRGDTWTYVPQPVDAGLIDTILYGINKIPSLAVTTDINNITYDIAVTKQAVWTANFAGMLRKSTDRGATWQKVVLPNDTRDHIAPTDTLTGFSLSPTAGKAGLTNNLNHRVFSVYASSDSVIWVGTAGGINKSTDGGISWTKYSNQNQVQSISGNFVVGISETKLPGRSIIWAATVNAEDASEIRGVSYTEDGGRTWKRTLLGTWVHNVSTHKDIVYAAADQGIFRSTDLGASWTAAGDIVDRTTQQRFTTTTAITSASQGDTLWMGGSEGLAKTTSVSNRPFGETWTIYRTAARIGNSLATYSYPLPFSPRIQPVRIHYGTGGINANVTIRIFNFSMQPVITLLRNAPRSGSMDYDEIWNGRDESNTYVANGVYFYRVEIDGTDPIWGKILVLR